MYKEKLLEDAITSMKHEENTREQCIMQYYYNSINI